MKNREKYKNELMNVIKKDGKLCEFVKKHEVFRMFGKNSISYCKMTCVTCGTALQLWLDEEYEEPPKPKVDWGKVPVDTLVKVRDDASHEWTLQYFTKFDENEALRFVTWSSGKTSKTAKGSCVAWRYCELLDEEHEECEVDWYNVPVDTPVRVRDDKRDMWILRHFKGIDDSRSDRYMAWTCGDTSKTSFGSYKHWEYCELVEDEDEE